MNRAHRIGQQGAPTALSHWRFFPWYVAGALGVVGLVNFTLVWFAVTSFPGLATEHAFDASNSYDRVLAAAERQAALGWTVEDRQEDGRLVLILSGRDGAPLVAARLVATAERPIGTARPAQVVFHPTATPGRFEAETPLVRGKWDFDLTVTAVGNTYHTVRHLVVK